MIYDIKKSFHENIKEGPFFSGEIKERFIPSRTEWHTIFDYHVMSPIGIFACPFTATAQGVRLCSQLGFDVITWKTMRSKKADPHEHPNVTFIKPGILQATMYATDQAPASAEELTLANSIGNASYELEETLQNMVEAQRYLLRGQILLASIYGVGNTHAQVLQDFVYLAHRVSEINVHAIELNLSCPNVCGSLYGDAGFVYALVRAVCRVSVKPITVKVGLFNSAEHRKNIMRAIARGGAQGITGINSVPARILDEHKKPFFGEDRITAGISGAPIFSHALKWVSDVAILNKKERFNLAIFGGGGIVNALQFNQFLELGATISMTATGALWNPHIASEYHHATLVPHNKGTYVQQNI